MLVGLRSDRTTKMTALFIKGVQHGCQFTKCCVSSQAGRAQQLALMSDRVEDMKALGRGLLPNSQIWMWWIAYVLATSIDANVREAHLESRHSGIGCV